MSASASRGDQAAPPLLELRGIVKRYPGILALDGVGLSVGAGEVHALVGENGAGKSTLMKVLGGATRADAGQVLVDGAPVNLDSPAAARAAGIGMIRQDLQLVPQLSVAENILLGQLPVRGRTPFLDCHEAARRARAALAQLGEDLDVAWPVARLGMAQRQLVEIARALACRVRILALDEPTSPLTTEEARRLFRVIERLRSERVGVIYISHRLDEVFEIASRFTVLRDGRVVHGGPVSGVDRAGMVRLMVGRDIPAAAARPGSPPEAGAAAEREILRVEGLSAPGVRFADFVLRRGEILGLAGLVGAGRSELAHAIFGAARRTAGRVVLDGVEIAPRSPREAIDLGIALLTEDRNRLGLVPGMSVRENVTLATLAAVSSGPFVRRAREARLVSGLAERLALRPPGIERPVAQLSGGNRQKVVLGRWLCSSARVLVFDEPTAGVDVGAKSEIHALIRELAAAGQGVVVISSDLPELLGLADRILVMREGRVAGEVARALATEERVMALATGTAA
jgi:ABC-type sugar transport system ATPase subunit